MYDIFGTKNLYIIVHAIIFLITTTSLLCISQKYVAIFNQNIASSCEYSKNNNDIFEQHVS